MPSVNIPLSVSDEVKQVHLADYDKNVFSVKTKFIPNGFQTEIGDIYDVDFKPQIKIKRWDNDANLSVRLASLPDGDEVVFTSGDKIRYKKGSAEARFYYVAGADEDSHRHEMDVILYEKPATNDIAFTISTKNLAFYKQDALTQEEIDNGANRAEDVIGSYAVFHKLKVNSVWLEKKAMHIYRPLIIDATGRKTWGELEILPEQDGQFGTMKITVNQAWLNTAIYPVVVDPTFGYTTAGGSSQNNRRDTLVGNIFTCPQNGKMYRMAAYLGGAAVGRQAQAGCYYSNSALFGYVVNGVDIVNGWNLFTEGTGPAAPNFVLTANSNYYLVVNNNSASITLFYDSLAIPSYDAGQTYNTWQDPETFTARANRTYSIYASYTITNTYSATLSLSANLSIRVNKLLDNGNIQLSAQYPGKRIAGISSAAVFSLASIEKTSRRTKSVTATLAADEKVRRIAMFNAILSLTADISKRINKSLAMATVTLSALEAKRWEGMAAVSTYISSAVKKKASKIASASIVLSSTIDILNTVSRTLSATISLSSDIYKFISKTLSSSLYLSSDEERLSKQSFSAAISLSAARVMSVSKLNQAFIYVSTSLNQIVKGFVDVVIGLVARVYKTITTSKSAAVTISASREETEGELLEADVTVGAATTIFIKKILSSPLSLDGEMSYLSDKEANFFSHFHLYPSLSFSVRKILEAGVQILASVVAIRRVTWPLASDVTIYAGSTKAVHKTINAGISLAASRVEAEGELLETSLSLVADVLIRVNKAFGANLQLSSSEEESKEAAETLSSSLLVSAEKVKKDVAKYITIYPGDGGGLQLIPEIRRTSVRVLSADISLSATKDVKYTLKVAVSASTALNAEKHIVIRKTSGVTITVGGSQPGKQIIAVAEVDINLSGDTDQGGSVTLFSGIDLTEDLTKHIGKTFTIREHTPSVWHNC